MKTGLFRTLKITRTLVEVFALLVIAAALSCSTATRGGASIAHSPDFSSNASASASAFGNISTDGVARLPSGITPDDVYDNRLLVRFKDGVKTASALEKYASRGVSFVRTVDLKPFGIVLTAVRVADPAMIADAYATIAADPAVAHVWPDVIRTPSFTPNDPRYNSGPIDRRQYHHKVVGAERAWDVTAGSENVIVAIVDTGCDIDHEDIASQLWVNTGETPGNGVDDDENDFIDDINGWDFYSDDNDPNDNRVGSSFHGTSTTGLAGAQGNNGIGVMGSAGGKGAAGQSGVRLMILRVGTDTSISLLAEVQAVAYAVLNGAKVINMSFGGESGGPDEEEIMNLAWQAGTVILAAGGNEGAGAANHLDWPAAFDSVICVGATNADDTHASYSKTGAEMELVAPGTDLVTTSGNNGYTPEVSGFFTGTSGSTPIVAGLAALIWSAEPSLTNVDVRARMQTTAVDLGDPGGDPEFGFGRVDFTAALGAEDDQATTLNYDPGAKLLRWEYANIGDYDFSGEVGVPDITAIAQNFGALTDDTVGDDPLEAWIDGSGDGEVGIPDITRIANYYLRNVSYYSILTSDTQESGFTEIDQVNFNAGATGAPRVYEIAVPAGAKDFIAVQPVDSNGIPSNMSNAVFVGSGV